MISAREGTLLHAQAPQAHLPSLSSMPVAFMQHAWNIPDQQLQRWLLWNATSSQISSEYRAHAVFLQALLVAGLPWKRYRTAWTQPFPFTPKGLKHPLPSTRGSQMAGRVASCLPAFHRLMYWKVLMCPHPQLSTKAG